MGGAWQGEKGAESQDLLFEASASREPLTSFLLARALGG
jgi:hypothetical protein